MQTLDPDILAQYAAGRIDRRDALIFYLDEGTFAFYAGGRGTLTFSVGGAPVDFVGSGSLISVSMSGEDVQQTQDAIEVEVASQYEVDGTLVELISTEALTSIEAMSWYRRPAIVGRLWIDNDGAVIDFEQRARCEIHEVLHVEDKDRGFVLRGVLQTIDVFRRIVDAKTRNSEFQALIDPADKGLDAVSQMATDTVYWGRKDPGAVGD